jgi:GAF domain-containing protein/HAMP domain-containing protein
MNQSRPEQTRNISGITNNSLSLQTRLVLFVLLVALVPLITIAVRDILQTQQALTNGAEFSLKSGAVQTANSLDNFIQNTLDTVGIEAQLAEFVNYLTMSPAARTGFDTRDRAKSLVTNLSKKDSHILSYGLVDIQGNMILDSSTDAQFNESKDPYFSQAQVSNLPIITPVTYSDDKKTSLTFASRVLDSNGAYIGILRVKYDASVLQDVIIKSLASSTDASVLLLDQLHIRMADNKNPELILKSIVPLDQANYALAVETHRFLNIPAQEQATNYPDFELALDNTAEQPFFKADITPKIPGDDTIAVAFLRIQPWIITYSRPTSVLLSDVQGQIRTNIILVLIASILISIVSALIARSLARPISALAKVANSISQGDLDARAEVRSTDEIGVLASAFNSMTNQLQSTLIGLENRVAERTKDFERSALELETIAVVTREISIIRDMDTLLKVSVDLIRERFEYYHVGIYLIEERTEFAFLRAASGAAAEQLLDEKYKVRVGQTGLVGNVTRAGYADMATGAIHFDNPMLPETQSQIVLPLRNHNITIGALDIQASTPAAFAKKDVQIFQTLADQLSAAIENAQLSQKIEGSLAQLTAVNRLQTQQMWQAAINQQERPSYEYDGLQIRAVPNNLPDDLLKKLENGKPVMINENNQDNSGQEKTALLIPLVVLGQVIGVIGLEQENPDHKWTDQELAIAQAAANRAGLTLENARLIEESQRRAIKERTIFESTARIGSALNIENILQTTVEELEKVLSGSEVILQFQSENDQKPGK